MLKKNKPFCFRHPTIRPNLGENSVCLTCDYREGCTDSKLKDLELDDKLSSQTVLTAIGLLENAVSTFETLSSAVPKTPLQFNQVSKNHRKASNIRKAIDILKSVIK